jgi:predicted aspartyl protease
MPSANSNHVVTGRHNGRYIITPIAIIDISKRDQQKKSNMELLEGVNPYRALIDTGATSTMLSNTVISDLGLIPVGQARFRGIHGVKRGVVYLFRVAFYGDRADKALLARKSITTDKAVHKIYICPTDIEGGEIEDQPHFDVLLGMDVLKTGSLHVDRNGDFSFSF